MKYVYLSIISSGLVVVGYLPEIYITFYQIKNVNSSRYSSSIWLLAGIFGIIYSSLNNEDFITINYSVNTFLNLSILILKFYYDFTPLKNSNDMINSPASLKIEEPVEVLQT
jgi:hypothetical protein